MNKTTLERNRVDRELKKAGFGGLNDPTLFDQIAYVISCKGPELGHAKFRSMLLSVEPDKRQIAYQSIAPKLSFKARPLEDYILEGHQRADQLKLPTYDPAHPDRVEEWKPQTIETQEYQQAKAAEITCRLCDEHHAVTSDGRWHFYGTPQQTVCADSRIYPDGYPIAPRIVKEDLKLGDKITIASINRINPPSALEVAATQAITRDLRELGAQFQLDLTCEVCTFEGHWRVKRKDKGLKIARNDGWLIKDYSPVDAGLAKQTLCPACKKSRGRA